MAETTFHEVSMGRRCTVCSDRHVHVVFILVACHTSLPAPPEALVQGRASGLLEILPCSLENTER